MVEYTKARIQREGWKGARALAADAKDTKLAGSHYTHVRLQTLVPMILNDWQAGLSEVRRLLRPNGIAAMTTWHRIGWLPDTRQALASDPGLPGFPEHHSDDSIANLFSPGAYFRRPGMDQRRIVQARVCRHRGSPYTLEGPRLSYRKPLGMVSFLCQMLCGAIWTKGASSKNIAKVQGRALAKFLRRQIFSQWCC